MLESFENGSTIVEKLDFQVKLMGTKGCLKSRERKSERKLLYISGVIIKNKKMVGDS